MKKNDIEEIISGFLLIVCLFVLVWGFLSGCSTTTSGIAYGEQCAKFDIQHAKDVEHGLFLPVGP